jgi:hypothetical protein
MGSNAVLDGMQSTHFDLNGLDRTYLDFYLGFGYSISVLQLVLAALLWQIARLAESDPDSARWMIVVVALATVVCAVVAYNLILPLPAILSLVLLATFGAAYALAQKPQPDSGSVAVSSGDAQMRPD